MNKTEMKLLYLERMITGLIDMEKTICNQYNGVKEDLIKKNPNHYRIKEIENSIDMAKGFISALEIILEKERDFDGNN